MVDVAEVEGRVAQITQIDRADRVKIGMKIGGVVIESPRDIEIIAERLARGQMAVPPHCREKAGVVYALIMQALEWGMPVMSVINKSYVVSNRGVDRIAYESQLIHAVIERNAPLIGRLRYEILGDGDERRCKVSGTFRGETKPHEYTSESLGSLRDARGRNDQGVLKGSPLWEKRPEVQMFYSTSLQWARLFAPDIVLGAYTPEEFNDGTEAIDVPMAEVEGLAQRLRDKKLAHARGFDADHVAREGAARNTIEGDINSDAATLEEKTNVGDNESNVDGRQPVAGDREGIADDTGASVNAGGRASEAGEDAARAEAAKGEDQSEIFPPDRTTKPKGKGKR